MEDIAKSEQRRPEPIAEEVHITDYQRGALWGRYSMFAFIPLLVGLCGVWAYAQHTSLLYFSVLLIGIGVLNIGLLRLSRKAWAEPAEQIRQRLAIAQTRKADRIKKWGK